MNRGKDVCATLKAIRKQVADANGIDYAPTECTHKGDCAGTCPKCEQEVRYIERQLDIRRMLGKAVTVAGVSVGLAALSGCKSVKPNDSHLTGDVPYFNNSPDKDQPLRGKVPDFSDRQEQEANDSTQQAKTMVVQTDTISEPIMFGMIVETMPSFPGGEKELIKWIEENLQYPDGFSGDARVIVTFTVQADGTVSDAKVLKPVAPELDAEALRLFSIMPKWNPGSRNGERVPTRYTVPIIFQTKQSEQ